MKLSEAIRRFRECGIESAEYDAREIFYNLGGFSQLELRLEDKESDKEELLSAVNRRCQREPLQYILGFSYFYREKYRVTGDCLIPREDTEILVDYAVKNIPKGECFIDLCTGSGCVGISVLKNTEGTRARLVDISEAAVRIAGLNAEDNGVSERAELLVADVTEGALPGEVFAVLSNPPYVTAEAYRGLQEEIYYEPKIAFVGGEDGTDFYRSIIPAYKPRLKMGGFMAFEIGYDQGRALEKIAEEQGFSCLILKDFSGCDRVAVLRRSE